MARLNNSPSSFIGYAELKRQRKFFDTDGWRQHFLLNSSKYGLVKNDNVFTNALVQVGTNLATLKVNEVFAIDKNGELIYKALEDNIDFPTNDDWYWLKVKYVESKLEVGLADIDINGNLVGTDTEFEEILRGQPNFPSKISFPNSTVNTGEYEVLSVIDDNNLVLAGDFTAETDMEFDIIGTFSPGAVPSTDEKNVFRYDGCNEFTLADDGFVLETDLNTPPTIVNVDEEFYIARVRTDGTTVEIEDKRTEIYKDVAVGLLTVLDKSEIPNIGVESIKYDDENSTLSENLIYLSWTFRSSNFTINTATNTITIVGGEGGKFKSTVDFTNGDFDGYRVYSDNGSYSIIKSSSKSGSQINLVLDKLDNDNFSSSTEVVVSPDAESIEIEVIAKSNLQNLDVDTIVWQSVNTVRYTFNNLPDLQTVDVGDKMTFTLSGNDSNNGTFSVTLVDNTNKYIEVTNLTRSDSTDDEASDSTSVGNPKVYEIPNLKFEYPINEQYVKLSTKAFKTIYSYYQIYYRLKLFGEYTGSILIPSDTNGYYNEDQYDSNGDLISVPIRTSYAVSSSIGFIKLITNTYSYKNIIDRIDTGDLIGVEYRTIDTTSNIDLIVGSNSKVQVLNGTVTFTSDHVINLSSTGAEDGNSFWIIVDATITLDTFNFEITQDYVDVGSTGTLLRTITDTDIAYMSVDKQQLVFKFDFDGTIWVMSVVEESLPIATTAESEGLVSDSTIITPKKLSEALQHTNARASEEKQGTAELATTAEAQALASDWVIMTPKKVGAVTGGLLTKVIEIPAWDMQSVIDSDFEHGLDVTKIVSMKAEIIPDSQVGSFPFEYARNSSNVFDGLVSGIIHADETSVYLLRRTGGYFNTSGFAETTLIRGYLYIVYLP